MQCERKTISIFKEDGKRMDEIKAKTGAAHSAIIRIAVERYHNEIIKKENGVS